MPKLNTKATRKLGLDMNLAGSWRSLGVFDLDKADIDAVLDAAETLVVNQSASGKLRITDAEKSWKPVLMYWSAADGWTENRVAN